MGRPARCAGYGLAITGCGRRRAPAALAQLLTGADLSAAALATSHTHLDHA